MEKSKESKRTKKLSSNVSPFIPVTLLPLILVFGFSLFQDIDEARAQGIPPFLQVF